MGLAPPIPSNMPSLTALRAFEAAARLGSFTDAADELLISPAGVAQHVKRVEAWAEQTLFDRSARGVALNDAGRAVQPLLNDGFERIGRATVALRAQRPDARTVRIAALPAVAQLWVGPRTVEINRLLPGAEVSVHAIERVPDLAIEPYDVAVFYEPSASGSDELVPVAAPEVAAQLAAPSDLRSHRLLHDTTWNDHWEQWLEGDQSLGIDPNSGTSFTLYAMAIDAAVRGEGVLIGRASLIEQHLRNGTLVEVFDRRVLSGDALRVSFRDPVDEALRRLAEWAQSTRNPQSPTADLLTQ
jgi:LysR family glycine cleavage system transcriptional activator